MKYILENRIETYKKYKKLFKNFNHETQKHFKKESVIGKGYQGKVYKYCKNSCQIEHIAVKKIYINSKQSKFVSNYLDPKALKHGCFIELAASRLINQLLLQNITPNFVFNYVSSFNERTGLCSDNFPYSSYYYNEFMDESDTYNNWANKRHANKEWYNIYFQIIVNIYILQKYLNMMHLDLHAGNILVKKIKKGGYWEYIIDDKPYKLPNLGYQIYIIDFGQAWIPNLLKSSYVKNPHKGYDLQTLFKSTLKFSKSSIEFKKKIRKVINRVKNDENFQVIINDIWGEMYNDSKGESLIESYNANIKLKTQGLPKVLKDYILNIKQK